MHAHDDNAEQPPQRWVTVASETEMGEEGAIERTAEGHLIAIFRHQGRLFALEGLCAHHGGPLSQGMVADGCVTCPWHGWQYHLEDGTHTTSGARLIRSFPVRERDGQIEIGL